MAGPPAWPAVAAARAANPAARVPFRLQHGSQWLTVGSVARRHLGDLTRWPLHLEVTDEGVDLLADGDLRQRVLADLNLTLRADGLVQGWRDEIYSLPTPDGRHALALIERATSRFWGTLTFGAHCNGYLAGDDGRPTHLWLARRSASKPTDPGLLDNLVGGGVGHGQTPARTLVREGWEEAGLDTAEMARAANGRVIELQRDLPEGLQWERLHVFDLWLSPQRQPRNMDGEVDAFFCLPVDEALRCAAEGLMTVDAALATLDFALRHDLLPAGSAARHAQALQPLWAPPEVPGPGIQNR